MNPHALIAVELDAEARVPVSSLHPVSNANVKPVMCPEDRLLTSLFVAGGDRFDFNLAAAPPRGALDRRARPSNPQFLFTLLLNRL